LAYESKGEGNGESRKRDERWGEGRDKEMHFIMEKRKNRDGF